MATEITEEVVLSHIKSATYFTDEEFLFVPKLLINIIKSEKISVTEILEWGVEQAKALNKEEVLVACVVVLAHTKLKQMLYKDLLMFEGGRPYEIVNREAKKMIDLVFGKDGEEPTAIWPDYKKACGLDIGF